MHENTSNLVVKIVCELDIRVKSYREKPASKSHIFAPSLPLSPDWFKREKNGVRPSRTDASVRTPARWSPPIPGSHPRVLRCFDSSSARQPRRRPARLQSLGLAPLQSNARCGSPRRSRRVPHSRRCPRSHAPEPSSPLPATSASPPAALPSTTADSARRRLLPSRRPGPASLVAASRPATAGPPAAGSGCCWLPIQLLSPSVAFVCCLCLVPLFAELARSIDVVTSLWTMVQIPINSVASKFQSGFILILFIRSIDVDILFSFHYMVCRREFCSQW